MGLLLLVLNVDPRAQPQQIWAPVKYVINFGPLTEEAVTEITGCCGANVAFAVDPKTQKCPNDSATCEYITLQQLRNDSSFIIQNEYPFDKSHEDKDARLMKQEEPYSYPDATRRKKQLFTALRSALSCHNRRHGAPARPDNPDPLCQGLRCIVRLGLPAVPVK